MKDPVSVSTVNPGALDGMKEHVRHTTEMLQQTDFSAVAKLVDRLHGAYEAGQRVFIFGNGGSAATASHFAEDLAKSTIKDMSVPRRLRVQSLTDCVPFISALGNDWGYEFIFREQLVTNASPGDVAIGISGSGNSPNVLSAVKWARENGLFTCGLTGFNGGKLKGIVDLSIHSPVLDMEIAENCHMITVHLVVSGLRARLAPASARPAMS
ncbi:MAG TPA: SIS domain-containing protein [Planctomycetota bacterium]|nr:SIS domain-containing protein [Planctomycetota bacterium]